MSAVYAAAAIVRRDLQLELSYRFRFVTQSLTSVFSLALFYYLSRLVKVGFSSPDQYFGFAVMGIVILQVLNSLLIFPPMALRQELVAGTWERIVASPLGAVRGAVGMLVFPTLRACVTGMVMLVLAGVVFGMHVDWASAPLALPVVLLMTAAFAPFGVLMIAIVLVAKQLAAGASWVLTGISLVGGLYFPVALLPGWIRWASDVQPFTPAADLMRHLLVDTPLRDPAVLDVAKLVGFAVVLLPLAALAAVAAVRVTQRRGTIIEY